MCVTCPVLSKPDRNRWKITRPFAVTRSLMASRDIIGTMDSGSWHETKPREEATFRVTYEVIFHDRSSRTHTYVSIRAAGHRVPPRHRASLSFCLDPLALYALIFKLRQNAKPALNGRSRGVDLFQNHTERSKFVLLSGL